MRPIRELDKVIGARLARAMATRHIMPDTLALRLTMTRAELQACLEGSSKWPAAALLQAADPIGIDVQELCLADR